MPKPRKLLVHERERERDPADVAEREPDEVVASASPVSLRSAQSLLAVPNRMSSVQRQALVQNIGQQYGNRQVQRLLDSLKPSRTIQRTCACGGTCAGCSGKSAPQEEEQTGKGEVSRLVTTGAPVSREQRQKAEAATPTVPDAETFFNQIDLFGGLQPNQEESAAPEPVKSDDVKAGGIERKDGVIVDTRTPNWKVTYKPFADHALKGSDVGEEKNFTQSNREAFTLTRPKDGSVVLGTNIEWERTGSGGGTGPGPQPKPSVNDPCRICDALAKLPLPKADIENCRTAPDKAAYLELIIAKIQKNPCVLINSPNFTDLFSGGDFWKKLGLLALRGLCEGGNFALNFAPGWVKSLINLVFDGLNQLAKLAKNCKNLPNVVPPLPIPGGNTITDRGKGLVRMETRYAFLPDGKIELIGSPPTSSSHGTAAQIVSPVQFVRQTTGAGGLLSIAPLLHSSISKTRENGENVAETHDFQQLFEVDLNVAPPPAPVDMCCGHQMFPFKVAKDRFEQEDAQQQKLFDWYRSLSKPVRKGVQDGKIEVIVVGRASNTGSKEFNLQLAEKRAKHVRQMMQDFAGTDAHLNSFAFGRLTAVAAGENGYERRADVIIKGKVSPPAPDEQPVTPCGLNAPNPNSICDDPATE
jgi:hypothetical protein